jgi:hypothetical protein
VLLSPQALNSAIPEDLALEVPLLQVRRNVTGEEKPYVLVVKDYHMDRLNVDKV